MGKDEGLTTFEWESLQQITEKSSSRRHVVLKTIRHFSRENKVDILNSYD
jgi:hypothetical protein